MFYYNKWLLSTFIILIMFTSKVLSGELRDYSLPSERPSYSQPIDRYDRNEVRYRYNYEPSQGNESNYSAIKEIYTQRLTEAIPKLTIEERRNLLAEYDKQYDQAVNEGLNDKAQVFTDLKIILKQAADAKGGEN